ncbi:hypothetical protein [Streptomyces diacarni]|uniref:hypothetical protein n=1 Tax=Streptomyces diacarni TaxID=2800381 RepID=UPI001FE25660|nr:hypothetical protein [Streptomyces diacarni]
MLHLDVRQSGNGILITSSPAEIDGDPATWPLRLHNEDNGKGPNEWSAALAPEAAPDIGGRGARQWHN